MGAATPPPPGDRRDPGGILTADCYDVVRRIAWIEGQSNFVVVIFDDSFDGQIDVPSSGAETIGIEEAFTRFAAQHPNEVVYVPGHACMYTLVRHPTKAGRVRVTYLYNLPPTDFYRFIERRMGGLMKFSPPDATNSVRYVRSRPLQPASF